MNCPSCNATLGGNPTNCPVCGETIPLPSAIPQPSPAFSSPDPVPPPGELRINTAVPGQSLYPAPPQAAAPPGIAPTPPNSALMPPPTPPYAASTPPPSPQTTYLPPTSKGIGTGFIIGIASVVVLLLAGGGWYYTSQALMREFDAAIGQNNVVAGTINAYSAYQKAVAEKGSDSGLASKMAGKAKPILEQKRQNLLDAWYKESDIGDATWDDHVKVCEWLQKIAPDQENLGQFEYAQGMYLMNVKNNFREAMVHFDSSLRAKPNWILAVNGMGRACRRLEDKASALMWYERAYSIDNRWPFCVINLAGIIEDHQKDHARAEGLFQEAIRLAPDRPTFHYTYANFLFSQGTTRYSEACEEYKKALGLPGVGSRALSPLAEQNARKQVAKICPN